MLQKKSTSLDFMVSTEKEKNFSSGPRAKILCSQCRGQGFDPWLWNQDPPCCTAWPKINLKTNKETEMERDEKAGRMRSISFSFLLSFSWWCSFLASTVLILLLPFFLLFAVLYPFEFSVPVLTSPSSFKRKSSLLVEGRDRLGEE